MGDSRVGYPSSHRDQLGRVARVCHGLRNKTRRTQRRGRRAQTLPLSTMLSCRREYSPTHIGGIFLAARA